jgi:hypothetical protein
MVMGAGRGALTERSAGELVCELADESPDQITFWLRVGAGTTVGIGSRPRLASRICVSGSTPLAGCEDKATQPPSIAAIEAAVMNHLVAGAPDGERFIFFVAMSIPPGLMQFEVSAVDWFRRSITLTESFSTA